MTRGSHLLVRVVAGAGAALVGTGLVACGTTSGTAADPLVLPVSTSTWDAAAPAWLHDGVLHVGDRTVALPGVVDRFVVAPTGAYWTRGTTLHFTGADGVAEVVGDLGSGEMAISADRTTLAVVDQSRGPTDRYGTHVAQVAVFDTRTGDLRYRTPDREPDRGDDLTDLYEETEPLLAGVSAERVFFDEATIELDDGATTPTRPDSEGVPGFVGVAETLFPEGYRVALREEGDGQRRVLADSTAFGAGVLSPDRTTIFDTGSSPAPAVAYDARTGVRRPIRAPGQSFALVSWVDADTFAGLAQTLGVPDDGSTLLSQQVVVCETSTLACTAVSPVVPAGDPGARVPALLVEGGQRL